MSERLSSPPRQPEYKRWIDDKVGPNIPRRSNFCSQRFSGTLASPAGKERVGGRADAVLVGLHIEVSMGDGRCDGEAIIDEGRKRAASRLQVRVAVHNCRYYIDVFYCARISTIII